MNYVYEPENQAQIAAYNSYTTPVDGVQEIFEKTDPALGEEPAGLPDRGVPEELLDPAGPARQLQTAEIEKAFEAADATGGGDPR